MLVGGLGNRSVVASASREAKARGARSAMPMEQARRMVGPHVVVTPRGARYREVSRELFGLVRDRAGEIEQVSIDEAFLHVPAGEHPARFAVHLVRAVRTAMGLTVSVGGGTTRLVAKLASTLTKRVAGPGTVLVVPAEDERTGWPPWTSAPSPGVGPRTREALLTIGVATVADLRTVGLPLLRRELGQAAATRLVALADNAGPWELELDREAKQTSHETTYETDRTTPAEIAEEVRRLAASTVDDLGPRVARTVTVKLRDTDFTTVTRSDTAAATADLEVVTDRALRLRGHRPRRTRAATGPPHRRGAEQLLPARPAGPRPARRGARWRPPRHRIGDVSGWCLMGRGRPVRLAVVLGQELMWTWSGTARWSGAPAVCGASSAPRSRSTASTSTCAPASRGWSAPTGRASPP